MDTRLGSLPLKLVEEHLKHESFRESFIIQEKVEIWTFFTIFSQKINKILTPQIVLFIILTFFMVFLGKYFNMCIFNIRRIYANNKNKVSI